jgi:hypothetical protein
MFDQVLDSFRKASESSLQMQQEVFKHWSQQWLTGPPNVAGVSTEWTRTIQRRWGELTIEMLNKHRAALDTAYSSGIQAIEQTLRVTEARSTEDYRRMVEDIWRKLFDNLKGQSEAQFRDFQRWAEQSFDIVQKAQTQV